MNNLTFGKIVILVSLILILCIIVINYFSHTYIRAEFSELDPMPNNMGVYYKGYKIGTTGKVKISKDFKTTYLFIKLKQRGLELPKNISANVKQYNNNDETIKYVDIIYPKSPMLSYIKTGDTIKGEHVFGLTSDGISETNQQHLDNLSQKGETFLASAKETTDSLTEMFDLITDIIEENRANIFNSTTSLKNSMANLENLTAKFDKNISSEIIKNSAQNIEQTTANLANSTTEFVSISGNFNKSSSDFSILIPKISVLIDGVQMVICNLNEIIVGVKSTLKERFSGARIIFGKAIK